jgi:hypothetical protein
MDIITYFLRYYAKFVPKDVLKKLFAQPSGTQKNGYPELAAELLLLPSAHIIPQLRQFIFSVNRKYISDRIKNTKGFILFIEYGDISFTPNAEHGVTEKIGLTVAHELTIQDNDIINETLMMNECYNMLIRILSTMFSDQKNPEYCPISTLINAPVKIQPVEPQFFFDCAGWAAIFDRSNSVLI